MRNQGTRINLGALPRLAEPGTMSSVRQLWGPGGVGSCSPGSPGLQLGAGGRTGARGEMRKGMGMWGHGRKSWGTGWGEY